MKRAGNLFEPIASRDNLRLAYSKALLGKRSRRDAREFGSKLETTLSSMSARLHDGVFPLGRFHQFVIHDPKERIITAPCFEERVLHHAIMNVCEPKFERWLIHDTYACRCGRGRIEALLRARHFAERHAFFLKLDVRKYFDSIPHERLLARLERIFKDRRVVDLFGRIVRSYRGTLGRGLPIGSLTSQHFANFYLGWLDRFVKETLGVRGYVRYMDDIGIWSESTTRLQSVLSSCTTFLEEELDLAWKPLPYVNRTSHGMDFLGCRVFRNHLTLNRRSRVRYRRTLRRLQTAFANGRINEAELQSRATSMTAFTRTNGVRSWRFRSKVIEESLASGH